MESQCDPLQKDRKGNGKTQAEGFSFRSGHGAVGLNFRTRLQRGWRPPPIGSVVYLNCELPLQETMP